MSQTPNLHRENDLSDAGVISHMTSLPILDVLLGLNGHPDPVKAAISKFSLPYGVEFEEVVQHCRAKVTLAASRFRGTKGKPFSFAYGIAYNEALNFVRNHGRRVKRLESLPRQLGSRADDGKSLERQVAIDRVRQAVSQLPDDLQAAIRLVSLEEKPRKLASQQLGLTTKELNERMILARGLLKRILTDQPLFANTGEREMPHALRLEDDDAELSEASA